MKESEEKKDLMKGHRASFWMLVIFSVLNTFFMINIYLNGLDALPQVFIQFPILLIGIILLVINLFRGFKFSLGSSEIRKTKGWKHTDDILFYVTLGIPVYNFLIMWFLAR